MWLNRSRQMTQFRNLRRIVDAVCQPPACAIELAEWGKANRFGGDVSKLCWHLPGRSQALRECKQRRWCDADRLYAFLSIIIKRESTCDHQTHHSLDEDRIANLRSWQRHKHRGTYDGNEHFSQYERWQVGYGWYGMNSANFVYLLDPLAPPEILCRRVPATIAALRRLKKALRKLSGSLDCKDNQGVPYTAKRIKAGQKRDRILDTHVEPTWWTLHRASWGGEICPGTDPGISPYKKFFAIRASKVGLDPDEPVTAHMLGADLSADDLWELDRRLRAEFDPIWTSESNQAKLDIRGEVR
jgi:hypothetical protein